MLLFWCYYGTVKLQMASKRCTKSVTRNKNKEYAKEIIWTLVCPPRIINENKQLNISILFIFVILKQNIFKLFVKTILWLKK